MLRGASIVIGTFRDTSAVIPLRSIGMRLNAIRFFLILCTLACADPARERRPVDAAPVDDSRTQEVFTYRACDFAPPGAMTRLPRTVPADLDPVAAAIGELLEGVSEDERNRGCTSYFSSRTANLLRAVHRSAGGDTVIIDFANFADSIPDAPGVKSFLPPGVMAELTWTIFQFPDVDAARFSFDADEAAFWLWAGGVGTAAQVYTRAMWEQI